MKKNLPLAIILSFFSVIMVGTILLLLPISTVSGNISISDAMFTATSAVTVTGLIVVDTATYFTVFGKTVIMILFQIGGLGFMSFSTLIILLIGKSISISDKIILENDFTSGEYKNIRELIKKIFLITFSFEIIGALLMYIDFKSKNIQNPVFNSVFHSISAFCNAGFSTFSTSFVDFKSDVFLNLILMFLIIFGGIGFIVLTDIFQLFKRKKKGFSKLRLHSKLVIITSIILILSGFALILFQEIFNSSNTLSFGDKILTALFQSVTARTAGFNTIDLNIFSYGSIFLLLILMFIGASPGSTGGGVKTTTAGMVLFYFRSRLKGKNRVDVFYRNIPVDIIEKAFMVIILSFILISFSFLLILFFEKGVNFEKVLFEVVSAFGTVGLSLGITSKLSVVSKFVIMFTMFVGRIGPLTLLFAMSRREPRAVYNYPKENIMIG